MHTLIFICIVMVCICHTSIPIRHQPEVVKRSGIAVMERSALMSVEEYDDKGGGRIRNSEYPALEN